MQNTLGIVSSASANEEDWNKNNVTKISLMWACIMEYYSICTNIICELSFILRIYIALNNHAGRRVAEFWRYLTRVLSRLFLYL